MVMPPWKNVWQLLKRRNEESPESPREGHIYPHNNSHTSVYGGVTHNSQEGATTHVFVDRPTGNLSAVRPNIGAVCSHEKNEAPARATAQTGLEIALLSERGQLRKNTEGSPHGNVQHRPTHRDNSRPLAPLGAPCKQVHCCFFQMTKMF